jgi:hypothetical protein
MESGFSEIRELLEEEIKAEIDNLNSLDSGSEEKKKAIDGIVALYKADLEEFKIGMDSATVFDKRISEVTQAEKDFKLRLAIEIAKIAVTVGTFVFYGIWMRKGLKFEETGSINSPIVKGLFSRNYPTK